MANKPLAGSERKSLAGARSAGRSDPAERFGISLILNRRSADAFKRQMAELRTGRRPAARIRREDFAGKFGAEPGALALVRKFAAAHGLTVAQEDAARRTVVLSGSVAQFNQAFGVAGLGRLHRTGQSERTADR